MKIELLKNKDGKTCGYEFIPESTDDKKTLGSIRNLHFWGLDDTVIKYDGIKTEDNYVVGMSFRTVGEQKIRRAESDARIEKRVALRIRLIKRSAERFRND